MSATLPIAPGEVFARALVDAIVRARQGGDMRNPVVHFEIMGTDGPALRAFYKSLFTWEFQEMPGMDYGMVATPEDGVGIGGGIGENGEGPAVLFYVSVDDVQKYLDQAKANGGEVLNGPMEVPGAGVTLGQFRDPQGNVIGLVKSEPPQ